MPQAVERAGNVGVWVRSLRASTGISQQSINKARGSRMPRLCALAQRVRADHHTAGEAEAHQAGVVDPEQEPPNLHAVRPWLVARVRAPRRMTCAGVHAQCRRRRSLVASSTTSTPSWMTSSFSPCGRRVGAAGVCAACSLPISGAFPGPAGRRDDAAEGRGDDAEANIWGDHELKDCAGARTCAAPPPARASRVTTRRPARAQDDCVLSAADTMQIVDTLMCRAASVCRGVGRDGNARAR